MTPLEGSDVLLFTTYKSGFFHSSVQSNTAVPLTSCHVLLVGANEEHDSIKYDCILAGGIHFADVSQLKNSNNDNTAMLGLTHTSIWWSSEYLSGK